MNSGKRKLSLNEACPKEAEGRANRSQSDVNLGGIDADVLVAFGINAEEAASIRSRNDLIRAIAYKMVEKQGEGVDEQILSSIELMIETDPELREFIDRSFAS